MNKLKSLVDIGLILARACYLFVLRNIIDHNSTNRQRRPLCLLKQPLKLLIRLCLAPNRRPELMRAATCLDFGLLIDKISCYVTIGEFHFSTVHNVRASCFASAESQTILHNIGLRKIDVKKAKLSGLVTNFCF